MSTPAPATERPDARRRQLVTALVVAVVLLLVSVVAAIAWAPRGPAALPGGWSGWMAPDERGFGPGERGLPDDDTWGRMERMHDWMHGDEGVAPPWWDEEPTPTPSPTD